jgi:hypothetical protein
MTWLSLLAGFTAAAAEPPLPPDGPPLRVVAFTDLPGNCVPRDAASAACIEEVRFLDLETAGSRRRETRTELRNIGRVHARLWESLAYHFPDPEDLLAARWSGLGEIGRHWESFARSDGAGTFAIPERAAWLGKEVWTGSTAPGGATPWFAPVRYAHPRYEQPGPSLALLRGRFAARLGFQGKAHDYMVMDADTTSGGPFFEQLYPFTNAMVGNDPTLKPLSTFESPSVLSAGQQLPPDEFERLRIETAQHLALPDASLDALRDYATTEFETFARLVTVQVAQYAMENYTPNHMRVLAALTQMEVPPAAQSGPRDRAAGLNAATRGQTDALDVVTQRLDARPLASLRSGFALRIESLPREVTERYLRHFVSLAPTPEVIIATVGGALSNFDPVLLVRSPTRITDVSPEGLTRWAIENAAPGADSRNIADRLERVALSASLELLPQSAADLRGWPAGTSTVDEYESWMFLDHVRESVSRSFAPNKISTPSEVANRTTSAWVEVLGKHGRRAAPIPQGLGGVDPTAVCARGERTEAQGEPSVSTVTLDALVTAADGLSDEDLLWAARQDLPFVLVDDPRRTVPTITRLVGLPDERAIYRVRWHVWSGWHLLWDAAPLTDASERIVARVAAVCSDTVLAPTDLVPTLVRAALLDDTHRPFRPTAPASARVGRRTPPLRAPAVDVDWMTEFARAELLKAAAGSDMLLEVFDVSVHTRRPPVDDLTPRTAYARMQAHVGRKAWLQVAGWTSLIGSEVRVNVAPGFGVAPSVESDSIAPRWARSGVADWHVTGGLGAFPLRQVTWTCNSVSQAYDVVAPCPESAQQDTTAGLSADVALLRTFWPIDDPRLAVEFGTELRLDTLYPDLANLYDDGRGLRYTWAFRPQAGLLLGGRWAPDLAPLWFPGKQGTLWGAERADGRSLVARTEGGLRVGGLVGPGYNGLEATALAELWFGVALRDPTALRASLTPYDPALVLGLFARGQYEGLLLESDVARRLVLDHAWTAVAGLRMDVQFKGAAPKAPTPPKPPKLPESPVPIEVPQ